jgi:hypothetical protein
VDAVLRDNLATAAAVLHIAGVPDSWLTEPAVRTGWPVHLDALRADPPRLSRSKTFSG